jgi:extracellular factor (EF) 3-hydroxypalmitic acid methyl ester biosynthesis protein
MPEAGSKPFAFDLMVTTNPRVKDSLAVFRTSQGVELRGNLLRFARHLVVLELYNPECVLQTSEVLSEFKIIWNDRALYAGRAVVRSLMHTGLVTVCEATLDDSWLDVDFSSSTDLPARLGGQFTEFIEEWQRLYRVAPDYKVVLADLQTFLTDVRLWLDQVELGIRSSPSGDRMKLERQAVRELEQSVVPAISSLFERFEVASARVEEDLQPAHHAFAKRQLHPLLLCSPFVYRTFQKPLGYAGDYEMVNMMFREPCEGGSLFAKMVNTYALQLPPIIAHRNRISYLADWLGVETRRVARQHRVARIFNLGCGPAHEIQRFLANGSLCEGADFTLADFNDETIAHTSGVLGGLKQQHGRNMRIQLVKKSVQQLLKQADRVVQYSRADQYDVVYCAGLFDYLSDKVCRKLMEVFYGMLAPGGLLLATNVDAHPARGEMECFLEWHLVQRNAVQMLTLAPAAASRDDVVLKHDPTAVNVLMEVRKPTGEN